MAIPVVLPDGREVEFPDGMSQEDMAKAITTNFPEFAPKQTQASAPEPREQQWQPVRDRPDRNPDAYLKRGVSAAMPYARPVIEGLASGVGGVLGAGAGLATGPVTGPGAALLATELGAVGGTLGYGAAATVSDIIENWATNEEFTPAPVKEQILQTGRHLRSGATYEMGGQLLTGALMKLWKSGKTVTKPIIEKLFGDIKTQIPGLTDDALKAKAVEIFEAHSGSLPEYEANRLIAEDVSEEIKGWTKTIGEATGDPGLLTLQRSLERSEGIAGEMALKKNAGNRVALTEYLAKKFPGKEDIGTVVDAVMSNKISLEDALLQAEKGVETAVKATPAIPPQETGTRITEAIAAEKAPVKAMEKELWAEVPNYEMPTKTTEKAFTEALEFPSTAEAKIAEFKAIYERASKTVKGLQTLERDISSYMRSTAASDTERMYLRKIKEAINEDFNIMGEAAKKSDVAISGGKIVYPKALEKEIDALAAKIAEESSAKTPTVDIEKVFQELTAKKIPGIMRQKGEGLEGWQKRVSAMYKRSIGEVLPVKGTGETPRLTKMRETQSALEKTLSEAESAVDIGEAYYRAKKYSQTQKFERFNKGAVAEIAERGNLLSGKKVPRHKIPEKFMNVEGAEQLIKAIGSKKKAGDVMIGHYADDLDKLANPQTGDLSTAALSKWIRKNGRTLDKYGIKSAFETMEAASKTRDAASASVKEFEKSATSKMLDSDLKQALSRAFEGGGGVSAKNTGKIMSDLVDEMKGDKAALTGLENAMKDFIVETVETAQKTLKGDNTLSPATIQKITKRFEPAMRVLYRSQPEKYKALKMMQQAVEIQSRSVSSPIGGGSDTKELAGAALSIVKRLSGIGKNVPVLGKGVKLAEVGLNAINKLEASQINDLLIRMMYDPELARIFKEAATGTAPRIVEKRLNNYLATAGLAITKPDKRNTNE